MLLSLLAAWLAPELGARGGVLRPELTTKLGVALVFLLHGMNLPLGALRAGASNLHLHALIQLTTFVLFPALGFFLATLLGAAQTPLLATAVLFLCALPSTISSAAALTAAAGGNVAGALFNAALSSLLGIVLTPLWMSAFAGTQQPSMPLSRLLLELSAWLGLPLLAGQLLRPLLAGVLRGAGRALSLLDRGVIVLLVYVAFCDAFASGVWQRAGTAFVLATLGVSVTLLCLALWFTSEASRLWRLPRQDRIAAVFCGSQKSLAAGVAMAELMFADSASVGLLLLPTLAYHSLQLLVSGMMVTRYGVGAASSGIARA